MAARRSVAAVAGLLLPASSIERVLHGRRIPNRDPTVAGRRCGLKFASFPLLLMLMITRGLPDHPKRPEGARTCGFLR